MSTFADETASIPDLLTVREVATQLGSSEQHIRTLLRAEILGGRMVGRQWMVSQAAIDAFLDGKRTKMEPDHPRSSIRKSSPKKLRALSFFSGAMGLDLGLEQAGIEILLACENDAACRKTIAANHPGLALIGDIREYSSSQIRDFAGLDVNDEIDLVVGGPPCQAFSTAGARKGLNDERGNVFLKFLDLIAALRPKYAVIENVRGLMSAPLQHRPHALRAGNGKVLEVTEQPGGVLLLILDFLRNSGYTVSFNLYNSANFGSPQVRERVILLCYRGDDRLPYLTPTHSENGSYGLPRWRTFREAVAGLPEKQHYVEFPEDRLRFYRMLKPGQYWKHLPTEELKRQALGRSYFAGGGKTGFLRRLAWDRPSPTLVTHPAMPATDLAHPELDRPLSIEEYKRLQQFPDDYVVCGSLIDQYRQIGNAVPLGLGEAVGRTLVAHSQGQEIRELRDFAYSRYAFTNDRNWDQRRRAASSL